ncbi:MAG: ABC transporter permease [Candidatus Bathyarchaeia archaeon]
MVAKKFRIGDSFGEWRSMYIILRGQPLSFIGGSIIATFALTSLIVLIAGNRILPYNPVVMNLNGSLLPPSWAHPFGTDDLGRDIFSRVIAATPIDAEVAAATILSAVVFGGLLGAIAGYLGGKIEEIVMRVTDVFLAFPGLILAMAIAAALGPSTTHAIYSLMAVWWPWYARLTRAETLHVKEEQYVESSRACGGSGFWVLLGHIIPNLIPPILAFATLDAGNTILTFSVLSWLGLGAHPPTPEWGSMVNAGQPYLQIAPWVSIMPALAIFAVVIGFSLFGDGLRDILDPRARSLAAAR